MTLNVIHLISLLCVMAQSTINSTLVYACRMTLPNHKPLNQFLSILCGCRHVFVYLCVVTQGSSCQTFKLTSSVVQ